MSDIIFDGMMFDRLREIGDQAAEIAGLESEIARLRLTDAEREAIRFCGELCRMGERPDLHATLRGLLDRTQDSANRK